MTSMIKYTQLFCIRNRDYNKQGKLCPFNVVQFYVAEVDLLSLMKIDLADFRLYSQSTACGTSRPEARKHSSPGIWPYFSNRLWNSAVYGGG